MYISKIFIIGSLFENLTPWLTKVASIRETSRIFFILVSKLSTKFKKFKILEGQAVLSYAYGSKQSKMFGSI